jgi:hypothetical protein
VSGPCPGATLTGYGPQAEASGQSTVLARLLRQRWDTGARRGWICVQRQRLRARHDPGDIRILLGVASGWGFGLLGPTLCAASGFVPFALLPRLLLAPLLGAGSSSHSHLFLPDVSSGPEPGLGHRPQGPELWGHRFGPSAAHPIRLPACQPSRQPSTLTPRGEPSATRQAAKSAGVRCSNLRVINWADVRHPSNC